MLSKLKKALGFGGDNDELISDDPDIQSTAPELRQPVTDNNSTSDADNISQRIFEHVVLEFNKALPSFLADSVDAERQKAYLFRTLSDDIKAHLATLENEQTQRLQESWRAERDKLKEDLKTLGETAKDIEAKRAELRTAQLSSERQRRALTDRVHDLEKQILSLEADKEQMDLEIKSMLNKVKVAGVYEKDNQALREQLAALQSELNKSRVASASGDDTTAEPTQPAVDQAELKRLQDIEKEYNEMLQKIAQFEEQMNKVEQITETKDARIKELTAESHKLKEQLEKTNANLAKVKEERDLAVANAAKTPDVENTAAEPPTFPARASIPGTDDILNDTDWIVNSTPRRPKSERPKSRKNHNNNDDGQMSLW